MKLYRYFHDLADPFRGFTEMDLAAPENYVRYIEAQNLRCGRTYDLAYFEKRLSTENLLREQFIRQGGKPTLRHPYYMVLESCDRWFYDHKGCIGSLCIDLSRFDPDTVSFTYGDSIPSLDPAFRRQRRYHGKVYTLSQLPGLIEEFGLPQQWNPDGQLGYETYIEAQIWTDLPLGCYRPAYAMQGQQELQTHCALLSRAIAAANPKLPAPEDGGSVFPLVRQLPYPNVRSLWRSAREKLTPSLFFNDGIHGMSHALSCGLYMLILGTRLQLPEPWLRTALLAGFFHDIGRTQGGSEHLHGRLSALQLPQLFPNLGQPYLAALQAAVHAHCLPDLPFDDIWRQYSPNEPDPRAPLIAAMLKDADSLDYVRLGLRGYNSRFLQLEESRQLIPYAIETNLLRVRYPIDFEILMWL